MKKLNLFLVATIATFIIAGCGGNTNKTQQQPQKPSPMQEKVNRYALVKLTTDISKLTENEKKMLGLLYDACQIMDDLFWIQSFGDKKSLLDTITDPLMKEYVMIHYGPWDRHENNTPFIPSYGPKPEGANFYPKDITKAEFEKLANKEKTSLYTMIRRNEKGELKVIAYHEFFKPQIEKTAALLREAATFSDDKAFKNYLEIRAKALLTDDYFESDMAWMDLKNSKFELVIGPIENYEDALYGYKAAYEGFILIKDMDWSNKLSKFVAMLPDLQKGLPVEEKYKKEIPGLQSDISVFEALYYAGDCNSGSKTIAINLPNDEQVHLKKGSKKLQLKNSMKAKFDNILVPIANCLIAENQRKHITFNAFFENVMFHEVAHGMGIKNTITGKGNCRQALKEQYSAIEENKADIMGLYLAVKLHEMKELTEGEIMDNFVTFFAGIFRSCRFGAASAHGKANMMRYQYFEEKEAFTRNADSTYTINYDNTYKAMSSLIAEILKVQGDGDYDAAKKWVETKGNITPVLQSDLDKVNSKQIPVDIRFEQGKNVIGL